MPPGAYPGLMDLPEVAEIVAATMVAGTHYSADWFPVPMPVVAPRPVVRSIIAVSQSRGPKVDNLAAGFVGLVTMLYLALFAADGVFEPFIWVLDDLSVAINFDLA